VVRASFFHFHLFSLKPVLALNSDITPVSARNLSRWLFLLARQVSGARPIRPPFVYRPITVVGADVFIRCLEKISTKTFPCDSPDQLPPGCYALFDPEGNPYPYPVGRTMPRPTFAETESAWDVPDDDIRAADRMMVRVLPHPMQSRLTVPTETRPRVPRHPGPQA
jgi:hypothetical protein